MRSSLDWISWAFEKQTGTIVGLGSCLCVHEQGQPESCPPECVLGALLFLRWGPDLAQQPRVLHTMQLVDIGGGQGYKPRLVGSGGALVQTSRAQDTFAQLIMKRPDVPSCKTPLDDRRPCKPLPRGTPTPSTNSSCAAVAWCCWGPAVPGSSTETCFQETDGPGPPPFVPGIASFDAKTGKWMRTVDLTNLSDEPIVEVSEQSFQLLEIPLSVH